VQTDQARFFFEHEDEQIIVIVFRNVNRRCDTGAFDQIWNGVAVPTTRTLPVELRSFAINAGESFAGTIVGLR